MRDHSVETGYLDGYEYFIVPAPFEDALNGYVLFPKKPVREEHYSGILNYVPVHGGITLCKHEDEGSMYGFDSLHSFSKEYPRNTTQWVKEQIKIMIDGILMAKKVELKYLKCTTNKGKAKYAQMVQDVAPEDQDKFSMGVALNLLSGKL
jgi:hypothetical protein